MATSAQIIPFPLQALAPLVETRGGRSVKDQRALSDAISAIQVQRDCLDALRLPLLSLRAGGAAGAPLRTLMRLQEVGPATHNSCAGRLGTLSEAAYQEVLPQPEQGTGDVLLLGSAVPQGVLQHPKTFAGPWPGTLIQFPYSSLETYIGALDRALNPVGVRVVAADTARLPRAWRGLRTDAMVPLFIGLGGAPLGEELEALPGYAEDAPPLAVGPREWSALQRYAPEGLCHVAEASWQRLRALDARLSRNLDTLAQEAFAEAGTRARSPQAASRAHAVAAALRASALEKKGIGHAPLTASETDRLLEGDLS